METFRNILECMLECYGNEIYKINYYKKLQGYGLRASDFEGKKGCSRRVFSHWKDSLLEQKLIRVPKIKRRLKDKTKDSLRNHPYVITPLGICYFSSIIDEIPLHEGKKIVEVLSHYTLYDPYLDWEKICRNITEDKAHKILKKICDSINIRKINDEFHVILSYRSRGGINYEKSRFIINQNQIRLQLPENIHTIESLKNPNPTSKPKIDNDMLFRDVANFIIESFCYSVVESYHWKIMNESVMLKWSELSPQKKLSIKKSINKYKDILEKIPVEVHLASNNFIGDNLFGEIKQEQKVVEEIYDYFYNKVIPKHGIKVEGDGKPIKLFSE